MRISASALCIPKSLFTKLHCFFFGKGASIIMQKAMSEKCVYIKTMIGMIRYNLMDMC